MKRANPENINTREFWNEFYKDREGYKEITGNTSRFTQALPFIKNGDKVLDIGCGIGLFTELIYQKFPQSEVWGVDISDEAIEENLKANPNIKYEYGVVGELDLPKSYFDVIFCGETIEHLDEPKILFEEAHKLLSPSGKLIITTPKDEEIQTPEHTWFFTQEDVESLYINNGYKNIKFEYLPGQEHLMIIFAVGEK